MATRHPAGDTGPLKFYSVNGNEIQVGDIVHAHNRLLLVTRTYPIEHIKQQAADVEDGVDGGGGRCYFDWDKEFFVLRGG